MLKSVKDARFPLTYKASPYDGKLQSGDGPYYTGKTENYTKYLVNEIEKHRSLKGRNISTDRLYTSISLAIWVLSRDITTVGTLNTNRVGIPKELKDVKGREEFSVTCHFEQEHKNLCLVTCSVKTKSTGMRNVVVLTTTRPIHGLTEDTRKANLLSSNCATSQRVVQT